MKTSLIQQLLAGGVRSIRVDGYIFFLRMGKVSHRKLGDATSGKNWKRTEKRVKANEEFTGIRYMSSHMKDAYDGLPVWKHAAKFRTGNGKTSDGYRHQKNRGFVNKWGEVTDFRHFVVSDGSLLLPPKMTMTRRGNVITLAWEDGREAGSARGSDILHAMVIGSERPDALMFFRGSTATRAAGKVSFTVQAREGETLHVYPFFGNATNDAFSPNEYFLAPAGTDETGRDTAPDEFRAAATGQEMTPGEMPRERPDDARRITRQLPTRPGKAPAGNPARASFTLPGTIHNVDDLPVIVPDGIPRPSTRSTLHVRDTDLVFPRAG